MQAPADALGLRRIAACLSPTRARNNFPIAFTLYRLFGCTPFLGMNCLAENSRMSAP